MRTRNDIGVTLALEFAHNSRTHHATVACHVDFTGFFHGRFA
jgi:hypothetical protein